jgi:oligoribonuclease (3'-5' exoribonuclease)
MSLDLEYTGFNVQKALIMEFGHTLVQDGELVETFSVVLDWRGHPVVPTDYVATMLRRVEADMGEAWQLTWPVMEREGVPANEVLDTYFDLINNWQEKGLPIVMHNGVNRDSEMLEANFMFYRSKPFQFRPNALIDTGAIVKASRALEQGTDPYASKWMLPKAEDTLLEYFRRVTSYPAKGVKWNMADAIQWLGLDKRFNLDLTKCHRAGYDSYLGHLLMEEFGRRAAGGPSGQYLKSLAVREEKKAEVKSNELSVEGFAQIFDEEMAKPKKPAPPRPLCHMPPRQPRPQPAPSRRGQRAV